MENVFFFKVAREGLEVGQDSGRKTGGMKNYVTGAIPLRWCMLATIRLSRHDMHKHGDHKDLRDVVQSTGQQLIFGSCVETSLLGDNRVADQKLAQRLELRRLRIGQMQHCKEKKNEQVGQTL